MWADDLPANVEDYPDARKIARELNERQQRLLLATVEASQQPTDPRSIGAGTGILAREISVHPNDVPAAMGMHRRGLVGTRRPQTGSVFHRRSVPGSKRWIWVLPKGLAVARHLPAAPCPQSVHVRFCGDAVTIELDGVTACIGRLIDGVLVVQDTDALSRELWEEVAAAVRKREKP